MLLCFAAPARAADITAASCSRADVQTAVTAAAAGDRVLVPAGACTWTTPVTIASKALTLQGAGIGVTTITVNNTTAGVDITGASATNFLTITAFTFRKGASANQGLLRIAGTQAAVAFRFHHNRILQESDNGVGITVTDVYGLIDHTTFDMTAGSASVVSVDVFGSNDSDDAGFTPWMRPLTLGTINAVYIEDSTFTYANQFEDSVDAYGGARVVIRFNTFNNVTVGFHGTDSGDRRSVFSWELYNNTFTNNSGTALRGLTVRGGTGVMFNNTYRGSQDWNPFTLQAYRACLPAGNPDLSGWRVCNGTAYEIGSTDFSAQASRTCNTVGSPQRVKFCSGNRELVCTSDSTCSAAGAGTCTTHFDGTGLGGYPCRDQPGRTFNQALAPIYAWNNGAVKSSAFDSEGAGCGIGLSIYLLENRDFFNNTVKPGYTAFTYPHPLQGIGGTRPVAPSGLTVQ